MPRGKYLGRRGEINKAKDIKYKSNEINEDPDEKEMIRKKFNVLNKR